MLLHFGQDRVERDSQDGSYDRRSNRHPSVARHASTFPTPWVLSKLGKRHLIFLILNWFQISVP